MSQARRLLRLFIVFKYPSPPRVRARDRAHTRGGVVLEINEKLHLLDLFARLRELAMRPHGEIRLALQASALKLFEQNGGGTAREIAAHACVGIKAAFSTINKMKRAGELIEVGRRDTGACRPSVVYAPCDACGAAAGAVGGHQALSDAMRLLTRPQGQEGAA